MSEKVLPAIGAQIRSLRKARGMTLQQLAARVGTSSSALHRYETGWDRFEVATLRRIASALDCHLDVQLLEDRDHTGEATARALADLLAPIFWDKRLTASDIDKFGSWVLVRVLMYGNLQQMRSTRRYFGDHRLRQAIAHRAIDGRTRTYWEVMLNGEKKASTSTQ